MLFVLLPGFHLCKLAFAGGGVAVDVDEAVDYIIIVVGVSAVEHEKVFGYGGDVSVGAVDDDLAGHVNDLCLSVDGYDADLVMSYLGGLFVA